MPTDVYSRQEYRFDIDRISGTGLNILVGWLRQLHPSTGVLILGINHDYVAIDYVGNPYERDRRMALVERAFDRARSLFPANIVNFRRYEPSEPTILTTTGPSISLSIDEGL